MKDLPLFPPAASANASEVDHLYFFLVAVSLLMTVLIFLCVLFFAIRYRRRHPDQIPRPIFGSTKLELSWSIGPLLIMLIFFGWGAKLYYEEGTPPPDSMEIFVTGKQWMWKVQHPGGQKEIDELHVPVGRPIRLTMASEDVIHSFYVPAFRVKHDVVPGHYQTIWFKPTEPGKYHLFCAEYCGKDHAHMIGYVYVMPPAEFAAWAAHNAGQESLANRGAKQFLQLGCGSCHLDERQGRGPYLRGLYGSTVTLDDGATVTADDAYIRESILNPNAKIAASFHPNVMPAFQGQVSEETIIELIAYIRSLQQEAPLESSPNTPDRTRGEGSR